MDPVRWPRFAAVLSLLLAQAIGASAFAQAASPGVPPGTWPAPSSFPQPKGGWQPPATPPPIKLDWNHALFFHWGSPESNAELLKRGNYDFRGQPHTSDLGDGRTAVFNDAVNAKLREWYNVGKTDAAGSGLYVSDSPEDTESYGADLLVAELTNVPSDYAIATNMNPKADSDTAYDKGHPEQIPMMTAYSNFRWFVVARPGLPGEPVFRFRPPRAEDVEQGFQQIMDRVKNPPFNWGRPTPKDPVHELRRYVDAEVAVASAILKPLGPAKTRSSDIFLLRLFFDRMDQELANRVLPEFARKPDLHVFIGLLAVAGAYQEMIPNDPRTMRLAAVTARALPLLRPRVIEALSSLGDYGLPTVMNAVKALPNDVVREIFLRTLANVGSLKKPGQTINFLFSILNQREDLYRGEAGAQVFAAAHEMIAHPMTGGALGDQLQVFRFVLQNLSGDPIAKPWILAFLKAMPSSKQIFGWSPNSQETWFQSLAKSEFPKLLAGPDGAEYAEAFGTIAVDLLDILKPDYTGSMVQWSGFYIWRTYLAWLKTTLPRQYARALPLIEARFRDGEFIRQALMGGSHTYDGSFYFNRGQGANDLPEIVALAREIPGIRILLVDRMYHDFDSGLNGMSLDDEGITKLLPQLFRQWDILEHRQPGWSDLFLEAYFRRVFPGDYTTPSGGPLPTFDYAKDIAPGIYPSGLRGAYGDFAKMSALVDPLLMGEKVGQGNSLPQYALNTRFVKDGKKITRPAWEDFLLTWDYVAMARKGWESSFGAYAMDGANRHLVAGYVDDSGRGMGSVFPREEHSTLVRGDDWKRLEGEQHAEELGHFFRIVPEGDGVRLVLKTIDELGLKGDGQGSAIVTKEVLRLVAEVQDPIRKAARILHVVGKLHPNETMNGRFARLWASVVLAQGGYPAPVGLPTDDVAMSEERLVWEFRRAVVVGKFYSRALAEASARGLPSTQFFQKVFAGSSLEGLTYLRAGGLDELKALVGEMETWHEIPSWTQELGREVRERLVRLRSGGKSVADLGEFEREDLLRAASSAKRALSAASSVGVRAHAAGLRCEAAFR